MIFINHDDLRSLDCFEKCVEEGLYVSDDIKDLKYAQIIYLGQKGLDRKNYLYIHNESVYIDESIFENIRDDAVIITLIFNDYMCELSKKYNFVYTSLLSDEDFINENSILTAEGLISYLISHRLFPLYHSHILVLGYGHCGSAFLKCLNGFDSYNYIYCKNNDIFVDNAHVFHDLNDIDFSIFDIIVNTVPEVIIKEDYISKMKKRVMIIDIASYPYGIDHHYALNIGLNSIILPSIPNKYAYKYAGNMIFDKIKGMIEC